MEADDVSVREQLFHNRVRETIICVLLFTCLYIVSYLILTHFKKTAEFVTDDIEDATVNKIAGDGAVCKDELLLLFAPGSACAGHCVGCQPLLHDNIARKSLYVKGGHLGSSERELIRAFGLHRLPLTVSRSTSPSDSSWPVDFLKSSDFSSSPLHPNL
ncbi:protein LMBR1L [Lates japonicus]|uniref:Protein LMBR1L n=1 Tax=Lates japonicus TaxID=270547 RepID=A0AAD3QWJ1_LATJO|nr:protein LMBR1L [Lates japonicus]